jgi:glucose-6-phosphate 1-dehydrogenase
VRRRDAARPLSQRAAQYHTLFNTAEGIERLWEVSIPLLEAPPPVRLYSPGSWGPKSIHQLVAPHAWRLPFERAWRDPNGTMG